MITSQPEVSVVVPVFNGETTIGSCLDSLLGQSYPSARVEIIVVDNASSDATASVLSGYEGSVILLREPVRGPSAARNRGVRAATGKYVAFTDADCVADSDWLESLMKPARDEGVGIVGGQILSRRPCNAIERFGETLHDHHLALTSYDPPYAISMNWCSPRSVLEEAGLFDETYLRCEDVDLSQKIHHLGYRLVYQDAAIVHHRNERAYSGLFREGYRHGVWAVKSRKDNVSAYRRAGHSRLSIESYRKIAANLRRGLSGDKRTESLCSAVFDIGKKLGKVAGSLRFGYLDL